MGVIDRIFELMNLRGVTAAQLTREVPLSNGLVTQWKQGKQKPSQETIIKLAGYFGVSTDYLLTGQDESTQIKNSLKQLHGLFNIALGLNNDPLLIKKLNTSSEDIRAWHREEYDTPPAPALLRDMVEMCKGEMNISDDELYNYNDAILNYEALTKRNRLLSDVKAAGELRASLINIGAMDSIGNLSEKGVEILAGFINTHSEFLKKLIAEKI